MSCPGLHINQLDTLPCWGREYTPIMAKYLYRTCPKCKDYLGVVVPEPPEPVKEVPIDARCLRCGFLLAWKIVMGRKSLLTLLWFVLFVPLYASSVYPLGEPQPQYRTALIHHQKNKNCFIKIKNLVGMHPKVH